MSESPVSRDAAVQVSPEKPKAVCLIGPTASGKTDLAIEIVQRLPYDIINVDSAQIYTQMDIGTGKPDAQTLAKAPHRLFDFLDPAMSYSASQFRSDAIQEMQSIVDKGRVPLLVGGTMMYFKALRDGLATMPSADEQIRAQILTLAQQDGWQEVHRLLAEVDPESAQRIHPNDPQRLQRAYEVYLVSGKTMSQLHQEQRSNEPCLPFDLQFIGIAPKERALLHQRIETRFKGMLDKGLVAEVEALYARGDLDLSMPSMRSVGYRQVWQYIAGEISFDAMVERGIIATRQLAKRQITWMRGWEELQSFDSTEPETLDLILKSAERVAI
ncbi:MAG: tRNA (adenosine(37)-N6)-dimethylallyltransferase MiaA [Pseudohongiellaceae bacterium]|nr:tRNA (adenosine(37)-N6)-dimethylallyltransferase MiaA [Pseudohongiellaceae bacterium]